MKQKSKESCPPYFQLFTPGSGQIMWGCKKANSDCHARNGAKWFRLGIMHAIERFEVVLKNTSSILDATGGKYCAYSIAFLCGMVPTTHVYEGLNVRV